MHPKISLATRPLTVEVQATNERGETIATPKIGRAHV
mgnify:CR=1 FL=1